MKQVIQLLILSVMLFYSADSFSQNRPNKNQIVVSDDGTVSSGISLVDTKAYQNIMFNTDLIPNQVPMITNYVDYVTNGNSLSQLIVSGDTIIVGVTYVDSVEAPAAATGTSARIYYNISYNQGATWASATGFKMGEERKTRFPSMFLVNSATDYTLLSGGRAYLTPLSNSTRVPGTFVDLVLEAGSATSYVITTTTAGYDYFVCKRFDGKIGGLFNAADSMVYTTFDPVTGAYSGQKSIFILPAPNSNFVSSYVIASSRISNNMTAAYNYINEGASSINPTGARSLRMQTSTDNGVTWTQPLAILQNNFINGDSVSPYWHEDIEYKPGTNNPYAVFCTRDVFTSNVTLTEQVKAYKIIIVSPALNGGNPVVVADYHNVPLLMDTNKFGTIQDVVADLQVNANPVSHPSVGFSTDGSKIYVTYAVPQTDTNTIGAVIGFHYFDIYVQGSADGGVTWSTPRNITNTPLVDEMYPVVAPTGNGNNDCFVTYMSNSIPGSQTFSNNQTIVRTPQILDHVTGVIGINNISSTVPSSYSLQQNYPNPFNPTTNIRFDVLKNTNITLSVYDVSGKLVQVLLNNEPVSVGTSEVQFNGANLSSGIYFYTISAGDFKDTKKMMLIK